MIQPPTPVFSRSSLDLASRLREGNRAVSPVRAADNLSGRYIHLAGWSVTWGRGTATVVSFLRPGSRQGGSAQLPAAEDPERRQTPPGVFRGAPHPEPRELVFCSWRTSGAPVLYSLSPSSRLSTTHASRPSHSGLLGFQRPQLSLPPLPGRENHFRFAPLTAARLAAEELPGRQQRRCLLFLLLLARVAASLELVAVGWETVVAAAGAPAAEWEAGEGRREAGLRAPEALT